jgi:hypothetical protein
MLDRIRTFLAFPGSSPGWFWESVLFPFLVTRFIWELVGYYAWGNYLPNPSYAKLAAQGFFLTRIFPLDIFARWDSKWYMSIIRNGYQPSADLRTAYSNIAFFPLYPYLVKSIGWFGLNLPDGFYVLVGVVLSSLFCLAATALLYRLIVVSLGQEELVARRSVGLLFVFPAGFFFSAFYPESLFLLLALLGFTFAMEEKWWAACLCAALAVLTRSQGVVLAIALAWLYMEKRGWRLGEIRPSIAWFALPPLALLAHFYELYLSSGDPFALFDAMAAWGRNQNANLTDPFRNLYGPSLDVFKIDLVLVVVFLLCSLYILWKWPVKSYGVFALLMCLMPLATGLLVSLSRYLALVFPVFILLGEKLRRREGYAALAAVWFALQMVYFAGWVNFYWIA